MSQTATVVEFPAPVETLGKEFELVDSAVAPIQTLAECQAAVNERKELGERIRRAAAFFAPMKQAAHKAWKAVCDREGAILKPLQALDGQLRDAIQAFTDEQNRLRRAEEQRQADELRKAEEARMAAEAAALERAGEKALAAAVVEQAIAAPAPVVQLPTVKQQVQGLKTRTEYRWRYAMGGKDAASKVIPRQFLAPDEQKIGQFARAMKGTATVPGIEFYSEEVPVR